MLVNELVIAQFLPPVTSKLLFLLRQKNQRCSNMFFRRFFYESEQQTCNERKNLIFVSTFCGVFRRIFAMKTSVRTNEGRLWMTSSQKCESWTLILSCTKLKYVSLAWLRSLIDSDHRDRYMHYVIGGHAQKWAFEIELLIIKNCNWASTNCDCRSKTAINC